MRYECTQLGTALIVVFLVASGAMAGMSIIVFSWLTLGMMFVFGLCLCMFHSLTVTVNDDVVRVQFAESPIRFTFPLSEIESCEAVRNRWWYGWGIKWYGRGWLYNVSGLDAVELKMKDGRLRRIGTDEPAELAEAISAALAGNSTDGDCS
jgi:hypothetical protein